MKTSLSGCTVVMATFNGGRYIGEQLESIDRQLLRPHRLIVSDDGSTDDTREIVKSFARTSDFNVLLIDGPQKGYGENFWSAAQLADSEYLAWADQDDVWYPEKLSRCVEVLKETEAGLVTHSAMVVDSHLHSLGPPWPRRAPDYRRTRIFRPLEGDPFFVPAGFTSVFRRQILSDVQWKIRPRSHQTDNFLPHDHAIGLTASALHVRVELADALASYRQHDSNTAGASRVASGILGSARITSVRRRRGEHYARLAAYAEGYADYLSAIGNKRGSAAAVHYRAVARRAQLRAHLRDGETALARLGSLVTSVREGNYRTSSQGGLGLAALASDSTAFWLSLAESFIG